MRNVLNTDANDVQIEQSEWSEIGGCTVKHPFSKTKRSACETSFKQKHGISTGEQADLVTAQALLAKAQQQDSDAPNLWTPTKTLMVVGGSMLVIGLVAILIVKAKKKK